MQNEKKYALVTAEDQNDYYCPLEIAAGSRRLSPDHLDDCVEAEVVGRYSGHLPIEGR